MFDKLPWPSVEDMEIFRREQLGSGIKDLPTDCYAVRISPKGGVTYLTKDEYNNLINGVKQ